MFSCAAVQSPVVPVSLAKAICQTVSMLRSTGPMVTARVSEQQHRDERRDGDGERQVAESAPARRGGALGPAWSLEQVRVEAGGEGADGIGVADALEGGGRRRMTKRSFWMAGTLARAGLDFSSAILASALVWP